ncbi:hypothetical protein CC2G_001919 [Coprinopsis cinerea AmutBmut pab1-1]|nr:hypothetical protein CC2G_001919 [Coprinopsis cinerea AmutBmut pab1-1]
MPVTSSSNSSLRPIEKQSATCLVHKDPGEKTPKPATPRYLEEFGVSPQNLLDWVGKEMSGACKSKLVVFVKLAIFNARLVEKWQQHTCIESLGLLQPLPTTTPQPTDSLSVSARAATSPAYSYRSTYQTLQTDDPTIPQLISLCKVLPDYK